MASNAYPVTDYCSKIPGTNVFAFTGTANTWVDLDVAEAAHSGMFKGKPLQVDVMGCIYLPAADAGKVAIIQSASLTLRMEKK